MRLVSRNEYAKLKGVTHTTINKQVRLGRIPVFDDKIDADAPNEWLTAREQLFPDPPSLPAKGTKADSERRKEEARADIAEIEAKKLKGELVEVADVQRALGAMIAKVQARILLVPGMVAVKVAVTADATQCERMIDAELRSALLELSQYRPDSDDV